MDSASSTFNFEQKIGKLIILAAESLGVVSGGDLLIETDVDLKGVGKVHFSEKRIANLVSKANWSIKASGSK